MSDLRVVHDTSPPPYPRSGSESDSDPWREIMVIDSDSNDSSIQVLPPRPPVVAVLNYPLIVIILWGSRFG